ncbi:MAG: 3-phosphoglycerate dehydrogenase [Rhodospirillaceae bacterium]|nr:3-phosphoglycerate dehydrogenase [Rhodospirillaceae bacterium]
MHRVLVAGRLHPAGKALLDARSDIEYEILDTPSAADIVAHMRGVEGVVIRTAPFRAEAIAASNELKIVSRHGVGYDNIEVPALTARGIPLTVIGTVNAVTVAEHALAMMLATTRLIIPYDREMRNGNYAIRESLRMTELEGKTVLIVGFGRIGTRVAKRCNAFDMNIIIADPNVPRRVVEGQGYRFVDDYRDALGEADILTLHMPGNPDGTPVMGAKEIGMMKPGAFLINCARGTLVDEEALVTALTSGHLRGAGLDVTREEPPADDHPLLKLDNVVLSPHSAGSTAECFERMATVSVQNVLDLFDGKLDPNLVINQEVLK